MLNQKQSPGVVFKNFTIFTGKHFITKRLEHRGFPVKFPKYFKNTFLYATIPVTVSASRDATFACKSLADVWTWGKV